MTRRQLLKTAGTAALIAGAGRRARAAGGPPLRLILWPSLNGAQPDLFWPSPGNLAAMSPITAPLAPYQKQLTFLHGVNIDGSYNHMAVRSMFTGFPVADYLSPDPTVQSLDQVVADQIAATSPTPLKSLHLGAIPADSLALYQLYGRSTFFFSPKPVDYEANPVTAFDRVFKGAPAGPPAPSPAPGATQPMTPTGARPPASYDEDVLDIVDAELADIGTRVKASAGELRKIDQHRTALKGLRAPKMVAGAPGGAGMTGGGGGNLPKGCNPSPLDSVEKLRPALQGKAAAAYQHQYYSDIFDAQIDIMSRALICGVTRVATLQAGSADGNVTDPVGPGYPHHLTSHGNQMIFSMCQNWYAGKFLRLLKNLDVADPLDPSGKTVLYNSVILWMSECLPIGHESTTVPTMIAGNGGGALKAGGYLDLKSATNKMVLQTIAQIAGAQQAPQFGGQIISELRA